MYYQRYSELSDEIRAKNKREDRLLDVRLKYYDREKNIRLNILRKEQYQVERTRLVLSEQRAKIQQERQRQALPVYMNARLDLEPVVLQRSAPDLSQAEWDSHAVVEPTEILPPIPADHPRPSSTTKIIRPHSAG